VHAIELRSLLESVSTSSFNFGLVAWGAMGLATRKGRPFGRAKFEKPLGPSHLLSQQFHLFTPTICAGLAFTELNA
jgi:hypothetical protein